MSEVLLRSCLRKRTSADKSTRTVQFVEGQPSDIIRVRVGDYFLEETKEWIKISMFKHFLIRDLRYRHPKRPDPIGDLKKALRSANRCALQARGKSRASSSTDAQGGNQFSALDQDTESNEEEDDHH